MGHQAPFLFFSNVLLKGEVMKRILIFGNSGAGKTTLAKELQKKFKLEHLDLDTLAWSDAITPTRKPLAQSINEIDTFLENTSDWVIEGCYSDLLEHVAKETKEMFFLNPTVETCIKNCRSRPWEPHKYVSKEEQDKNLEMLVEWVKQYFKREDEFSIKSHRKLFDSFAGNKKEVKVCNNNLL